MNEIRTRPPGLLPAVLLLSALLGAGCDSERPRSEGGARSGPTAAEADDGEGAASPNSRRWSFSAEPLVRIGETEGEAAYLFQRVAGVVPLPGGGVAVADGGSLEIRVYDAAGRFLRSMAGPGQGPGELEAVGDLLLLPPDTLAVWDAAQGRLSRFLLDGTLVSTATFRAENGWPERLLGRFADGSWAAAWIAQDEFEPPGPTPRADPMVVGRYGPDGSFLGLLARATGLVRLGTGVVPFPPFLHGAVVEDTLYLTDGTGEGVRAYSREGRAAGALPLPVRPPETRTAWSALHDALAAAGQLERLEGTPDGAEEVPIPPVARMLADDAGRLWLKRLDPSTDSWLLGAWAGRGPGGMWVVLGTDGSEVARVEAPAEFVPLTLSSRRAAGVTRDALGVERVEVWGLEEPGGPR